MEGGVDIEVLEGAPEDQLPEGERYDGNDSDHIREGDNNNDKIVDDNEDENVDDIYDENGDNEDDNIADDDAGEDGYMESDDMANIEDCRSDAESVIVISSDDKMDGENDEK